MDAAPEPVPNRTKGSKMSTIGNLPAADLDVTFPSGETRTVNMIILLVETQNAEWHAKYGTAMPGVNRLPGITIQKFRDKYELDWFFDAQVKTWKDCAAAMRHIHGVFSDHIDASRSR
jgi:hypothetical protein